MCVMADRDTNNQVDMAHGALIRHWQQLQNWLNEDRPGLLLREELWRAAREWDQQGRGAGYLSHQGERLDRVRALIRSPHLAPNDIEQDYVRASVTRELADQRERTDLAEQAQRESERRLAEQQRFLRIVIGLAALVFLGAILAFFGFREAEAQRLREYKIALENASRGLARQAEEVRDDEIDLSLLLAAEAYQTRHTPEARNSLMAGLVTAPHLSSFLENPFGAALALEFSPKQSENILLATGHESGIAVIWNLSTEQPVSQLTPPEPSSVLCLAFSRNGELLVTGHADGRIMLWDPTTGKPQHSIGRLEDAVTSVAWSPDQTKLVSAGADGRVMLWDPAVGRELDVLGEDNNAVTSVAFSPVDNDRLASGTVDGRVLLWNTQPNAIASDPLTLHGGREPVWSLAFSPNGQTLAAGQEDGTTFLWNVESQVRLLRLSGHSEAVTNVVFSSDTTLATGSADSSIILWNAESGQQRFSLEGHPAAITGVAVSPDGTMAVSGGWDGTLIVWKDLDQPLKYPIRKTFPANDRVESLAFSPDSAIVASGQADGTIIVWDVAADEARFTLFTGSDREVTALAFNPAGTRIASGQTDGAIILWDAVSGRALERRRGSEAVTDLAYSPRDGTLATGYQGGIVRLWEESGGQDLPGAGCGEDAPEDFACTVTDLAYSQDGTTLAAVHNDETVVLWDVAEGTEPRRWDGSAVADSFVAFNADGASLASGHGNGTVQLRTVSDGAAIGSPTPHRAGLSGVAFSPDGNLFVSSSADGELMFRDPTSGEQIVSVPEANLFEVTTLAISPDGQTLASGGRYGVALWDLDSEQWLELALKRANRLLSDQEQKRYKPQLPSPPEPFGFFFITPDD
jgi:WD40 repeat protein